MINYKFDICCCLRTKTSIYIQFLRCWKSQDWTKTSNSENLIFVVFKEFSNLFFVCFLFFYLLFFFFFFLELGSLKNWEERFGQIFFLFLNWGILIYAFTSYYPPNLS